jgi:hypothetical protein
MLTIRQALDDPALFGGLFDRSSWRAWRTFLAALFGLPAESAHDLDLYRQCTGRRTWPPDPAAEAWLLVGRRGGKSRIAALIAVYLAAFRDYRPHLAAGEVATVALIAADRRQARVLLRYVRGFFDAVPMLRAMIRRESRESLDLDSRVVIEVHTASFRATRGYTLAAVVADEIAFWPTDEAGANPDVEIIHALRPGLATIPGALLLAISSPYARRGALWEAYRRHYGQDGDRVLIWQAPTRTMHPRVDQAIIDAAYAADDSAAAAEYGAEFRRDVESFVSREIIDACTVPGRHELPPAGGVHYRAFVDPSGGSQDSMTLAIAHDQDAITVVDAIREVRPPFNPDDVTRDFAALLHTYRIATVTGDRYAGEWPRERFRAHGIAYQVADRAKSDIYRDLLPRLSAHQVELLDHPRCLAQLATLERRTARGGRDSIDHGPRAHDDVANAVAGAVVSVDAHADCVAPISVGVRRSPFAALTQPAGW